MSRGPLLLPNLGAEEGGDWRQTLLQPRIAAAARLWRLLFSASARVAEGAAGVDPKVWPSPLAAGRDAPAFDWLEDVSGCVPWLANRSSREEASAWGLMVPGPPADVVERVHDKAFALLAAEKADLVPRALLGTTRIFDPDELVDADATLARIEECLSAWPAWTVRRFTLKPRYGTSGRGRVNAIEQVRAALPRLAARGGAILEPWLTRTRDLSVQLRITAEGEVVILASLELLVGPAGSYRGHRGEVDSRGRVFSGLPEEESLREAGALVASAAWQAGFHGPAALDALCFRIPGQEETRDRLRPVVELNARFSMGIVATGLVRRVLPDVRRELDLGPGARRAFLFLLGPPPAGWDAARDQVGPDHLFVPLWSDGDSTQPALLFADRSERLDQCAARVT